MAPELRSRKRKASTPASTMAPTKTDKKAKPSAPATKRKATNDSSPVSKKKVKASTKPTKTSKKAAPAVTDSADEPNQEDEPSDFDDEDEEEYEKGAIASGEMMKLIDSESEEEEEENEEEAEAEDDVEDNEKAIVKVPKVPKHEKPTNNMEGNKDPGVIYVGRIPHGFFEHQMQAYFSQFGDVTKLRLSRNKKTGASKHYAFVEFADQDTAEIVAKTMDNYLLFGHILKVKMVPQEKVHADIWKGCNKRFNAIPRRKIQAQKMREARTEHAWGKAISKETGKRQKMAAKLKAMDYDFQMPLLMAPPKPVALISNREANEMTAADETEEEGDKVLAIEAPAEVSKPVEKDEQSEEVVPVVKMATKQKRKKMKA